MTVDVHTEYAPEPRLLVTVLSGHRTHVVRVTGELDLATCDRLVTASTAGHHPKIVIDLSGVTFMDCSGYGALVASRLVVEAEGRSLTTTGQTGQPARLHDLIAGLETCPLRPGPEPSAKSAGPNGDTVGSCAGVRRERAHERGHRCRST